MKLIPLSPLDLMCMAEKGEPPPPVRPEVFGGALDQLMAIYRNDGLTNQDFIAQLELKARRLREQECDAA